MKNILIAHDLTDSGAAALQRGLSLAAIDQAAVRLVHVIAGRLADTERGVLAEELNQIAERTKHRYPGIASICADIADGDRATAIARAGEDHKADLIVVGGHGAMRMRDGLFGTTVERLLRITQRPVLVVRNDPGRPYARMIAAIGGEEDVDETLALACSMESVHEVLAVHAWFSLRKSSEKQAAKRHHLEDVIRKRAKQCGLRNIHLHSASHRGDPMSAVLDAFDRIDADLVAMTTHARSGFSLAWNDSFADLMLEQSTVDLLVQALPR